MTHKDLETEQLLIRPLEMEDLHGLYSLGKYPSYGNTLWAFAAMNDEFRNLWIFKIYQYRIYGFGKMAVLRKNDKLLIGSCARTLCLHSVC